VGRGVVPAGDVLRHADAAEHHGDRDRRVPRQGLRETGGEEGRGVEVSLTSGKVGLEGRHDAGQVSCPGRGRRRVRRRVDPGPAPDFAAARELAYRCVAMSAVEYRGAYGQHALRPRTGAGRSDPGGQGQDAGGSCDERAESGLALNFRIARQCGPQPFPLARLIQQEAPGAMRAEDDIDPRVYRTRSSTSATARIRQQMPGAIANSAVVIRYGRGTPNRILAAWSFANPPADGPCRIARGRS
jgi:hypothetical protein